MEYEIHTLDAEGFEIAPTGSEHTKAEAIAFAKRRLTDAELSPHKVEIRRDGECIWDRFA